MSHALKLTHFPSETNASITIRNRMRRAAIIAQESTCRQKHGAILMQGSRVLAVGVNSYRNEPGSIVWDDDESKPAGISVHAEVQATKTHLDVPNTTLYVVRVGAAGLMNSRPCPECVYHLIWNTTVKEVIYS